MGPDTNPPGRTQAEETAHRSQAIAPDVIVTAAMLVAVGMHLLYVWRNGAFLPPLERLPWVPGLGMLLVGLAGTNLVLFLLFRTRWFRAETPRQRWRHGWMLLVTIGVLALLPVILRAEGVRNAAFRRDLGGRLQPWAMELLSRPATSVVDPGAFSVRKNLIPDDFFRSPSKNVTLESEALGRTIRDGNEPHLVLHYGGGFLHWGYLIGAPTFRVTPARNAMWSVDKMADGVYRFTER